MKYFFFFTLFLIFLPSCEIQKQQERINKRETELNQREQQLLLKEDSLQLMAAELTKREMLLDSTQRNAIDTLSALYPGVPGIWNVSMKCTETTCSGSAVGDTKKEQWEITFHSNTIIAKARSDNKLLRIYSGSYIGGNIFELSAEQENVAAQKGAKMFVRLQKSNENQMTGQREISRPEDCRIVYSLELSKQ